ncbi:urease accessory protein [Andreprevotia lacus DSM 23236]|jgi:urease accessory protein|uniref:Urease accessory protein n=1 Tax=Andreprevotia lacus DSM 23236 TaxID=1121001 RepID=A0A1W1Y140_9NEIS|nr:HupE/UreJ family protein [Andreprevotia lacus]SMC29855.1 urease accessory protein [Andreprevotia lacus DSM 23236]
MSIRFRCFCLGLLTALGCLPGLAWAHVGQGDISGGFMAGFLHPLEGPDHIIAMVAVGLWGAQLGRPAIWVLPVTFPVVMAFGGALGGAGIALPGIEIGIAMSGIVLGAMVALALRLPLGLAGGIVAVFAICHGHAHGVELPQSANPITYAAGFVIATGLLHLAGILFGTLHHWRRGAQALRTVGAMIAAGGGYFLYAALQG